MTDCPKTKIKICGLSRMEDIDYVNEALPDYIGFITYKKSRRYVTPQKAAELKSRLDPRIRAAAVFVDEPAEFAASYVQSGTADIIQLHGHEDEEYIRSLRRLIPEGTPIIKAFLIKTEDDIKAAEKSSADYILLDNGFGTGKTFSWDLLTESVSRPFFLAGGLDPDNIADAVAKFHPFAADISSGVETDGVKDRQKIKDCVECVRKC